MKHLFVVFCVLATPLAWAQSATLNCKSVTDVDGWTGTPTLKPLILSGQVEFDNEITEARLTGAYLSDQRTIKLDETFVPKAPKYKEMNRYGVLEDAWCWFQPLIQKEMSTHADGEIFKAYILIRCESGSKPTVEMNCSLSWEH